MNVKAALITLAVAAVCAAVSQQAAAVVPYRITDLAVGQELSVATAVNASGQVTGYSQRDIPGGDAPRGFLYSNGTRQDLGDLGGINVWGYDINNLGQVTGASDTAPEPGRHAFLYSGGTMQDLGTLRGGRFSEGFGINDSAQVTGRSENQDSLLRAFLYSGGAMQDLGTLGGASSVGQAVNNRGHVTGQAETEDGDLHAFLYSGGAMQDVHGLGDESIGLDINESGQIAGSFATSGVAHAFLYSDGSMHDLGTLPGGTSSIGYGINNLGHVVGQSGLTGGASGFLYDGTSMHDLQGLVLFDAGSVWHSLTPYGINDAGWIVGEGTTLTPQGFTSHAFLLTPIPEPATWALVLAGLGLIGGAVVRARKAA